MELVARDIDRSWCSAREVPGTAAHAFAALRHSGRSRDGVGFLMLGGELGARAGCRRYGFAREVPGITAHAFAALRHSRWSRDGVGFFSWVGSWVRALVAAGMGLRARSRVSPRAPSLRCGARGAPGTGLVFLVGWGVWCARWLPQVWVCARGPGYRRSCLRCAAAFGAVPGRGWFFNVGWGVGCARWLPQVWVCARGPGYRRSCLRCAAAFGAVPGRGWVIYRS